MIDIQKIQRIYQDAAARIIARKPPLEALWLQIPELAGIWAQDFVAHFPGTENSIAYAVKANADPVILKTLRKVGIENFEVATLAEARTVRRALGDTGYQLWFHNPLNSERQLEEAYRKYGARDFVITDPDGLNRIRTIIPRSDSPAGVRLSVRIDVDAGRHTTNASFSHLFPPDYSLEKHAVPLVAAAAQAGFRCSLYFNISTQTTDPGLYAHALTKVDETLISLKSNGQPVELETINVGAGFPMPDGDRSWQGYGSFFSAISSSAVRSANGLNVPFAAEPGRALVAPAEALMIPVNRINKDHNGLVLSTSLVGGWHHAAKLPDVTPIVFAIAGNGRPLTGETRAWRIFGGSPASFETAYEKPLELAADIKEGDYLLLLMQGGYGRALASGFNGLSPERPRRIRLNSRDFDAGISAVQDPVFEPTFLTRRL